MTIPILDKQIENYLNALHASYDEEILCKMETYGHEKKFPIIDRLCGSFIYLLAEMISAKKVFELGSGYGYSAYWFCRSLQKRGGKVICTDDNFDNKKKAEEYLSPLGFWSLIDYRLGEARQIFSESSESFDIIYNDINKGDYPDAWLMVKSRLKSGGLYICDNTLWYGRVAQEDLGNEKDYKGWTKAIKEHNQLVFADKDFESTLIPLRDGILVARRI